jgi:malonyl-CoA O-methyltransferase
VNPVDKARVRAAFTRGAPAYDARAGVQPRVRARALAMALEAAPSARRVLDVGAGTGRLLASLLAERPGVRAVALDLAPGMCLAARATARAATPCAADAERLPFRGAAFDLVLSTSTLQWLPRLEPALSEAARVLAPGGRLVVGLFAERSLRELRAAWRAAADGRAPDRTHRFFTPGQVAGAVAAAGLRLERLLEEEHVERHADARALLRSLKAIGAQGAAPGAGLGHRSVTLEMLRRYDATSAGEGGVAATWHVVYAVASR